MYNLCQCRPVPQCPSKCHSWTLYGALAPAVPRRPSVVASTFSWKPTYKQPLQKDPTTHAAESSPKKDKQRQGWLEASVLC